MWQHFPYIPQNLNSCRGCPVFVTLGMCSWQIFAHLLSCQMPKGCFGPWDVWVEQWLVSLLAGSSNSTLSSAALADWPSAGSAPSS